jgi:hypothetical protein
MTIYPAYQVESLDPATLEQLKNTLQPARFTAGSRTGGSGTVYPNIRSSRDLLVTDVIQHATNLRDMTEFWVVYRTSTGIVHGTLIAKNAIMLELVPPGGDPVQSPPGISVEPGTVVGIELHYMPSGFTDWNRGHFFSFFSQESQKMIASYLWQNTNITQENALLLFEQGGWKELSGLGDNHFLLERIIKQR